MPEAFAPSQLDNLSAEYKALTGTQLLNHVSHPTAHTTRWAFSDAYVALTYNEAIDHAATMVRKALTPENLARKAGHNV